MANQQNIMENFNMNDYIIKEINKLGNDGKFYDARSQLDYWKNFFNRNKTLLDKKARILDYGSGGGYCIYVGRNMGYNIEGLDIDQEKLFNKPMFNRIKKVLKVENNVTIYDGETIFPFEDNIFDFVISKNSIRKDLNYKFTNKIPKSKLQERKKKRISELSRITKKGGTWFIIPPNNKRFINVMLRPNDKKIKVVYTK